MKYGVLTLFLFSLTSSYLSAFYDAASGNFSYITKPMQLRNLNPPNRTPEKLTGPLVNTYQDSITFINVLSVDEPKNTLSNSPYQDLSYIQLTLPVDFENSVDFTNEAVGVKILESSLQILREEDITPLWIKNKR